MKKIKIWPTKKAWNWKCPYPEPRLPDLPGPPRSYSRCCSSQSQRQLSWFPHYKAPLWRQKQLWTHVEMKSSEFWGGTMPRIKATTCSHFLCKATPIPGRSAVQVTYEASLPHHPASLEIDWLTSWRNPDEPAAEGQTETITTWGQHCQGSSPANVAAPW